MNITSSKQSESPHLSKVQVTERLQELENAIDQRRTDLIAELAWRPAWAIRSRRGVMSLLLDCWLMKRRRQQKITAKRKLTPK